MKADLIIFDCDGVLVDSEPLAARCVSDVLKDFGYEISGEEIDRRFAGVTDRQIGERLAAEGGNGLPDDFEHRVERRTLALFEEELQAVPGIAALLAALNGPRCIASNSARDRLRRSLDLTGLGDFFEDDQLFSARQVANPKPAPDLHRFVLDRFGLAADKAVVIEDSVTGATAALAAGISVIGFTATSQDPTLQAERLIGLGASAVTDDLARIPDLIAGI